MAAMGLHILQPDEWADGDALDNLYVDGDVRHVAYIKRARAPCSCAEVAV